MALSIDDLKIAVLKVNEFNGNVTQAALSMGIGRSTLRNRIARAASYGYYTNEYLASLILAERCEAIGVHPEFYSERVEPVQCEYIPELDLPVQVATHGVNVISEDNFATEKPVVLYGYHKSFHEFLRDKDLPELRGHHDCSVSSSCSSCTSNEAQVNPCASVYNLENVTVDLTEREKEDVRQLEKDNFIISLYTIGFIAIVCAAILLAV